MVMHKRKQKISLYHICVNTLLVFIIILIVYPIIYVFSASLSSAQAVVSGKVVLFPKEFTLDAYKYVLRDKSIWLGYVNGLYYTIFGTIICVLVTMSGAYPLSKENLPGKGIIMKLVVFSMWFSAGMIPTYLNIRDFGLLNSRAAILIPFACDTFNFILMRNFFSSVPRSLEEAARIDGANQFTILTKIYIPLSTAAIATISLFYAVGKWNGYLWSLILLRKDELMPLQVIIKKMIVDLQVALDGDKLVDSTLELLANETVIYASIIVSALPMLILYPFIQKFFVKGVMVGAVKE